LLLLLLAMLAPAAAQQVDNDVHGKPVTLNFKDADIQALISTVSEITGRNFIVDPRVQGKVTVISAQPTAPEAVYDVFVSILKVHGFSAVPFGDVIKIVPDATARQEGSTGPAEEVGDELVTGVLSVENVSALDLVPILRPLLPQEAHLAAHAGSNALIISATNANVRRLMDIIRRIDKDASQEVEVITLKHADAQELVGVLQALGQGAAGDAQRKLPTLVADGRTNSILLGGEPNLKLQYRTLITHLDMPVADDGDIEVIYLRYAAAADLVPVLQGIVDPGVAAGASANQQGRGRARAGQGTGFNVQADEANNALIIQAPPRQMQTLLSVVEQLDVRRSQVLVEGIIAEVTSDTAKELGVQWQTSLPGGDGAFAGSRFGGVESGPIDDPFDDEDSTSLLTGLTLGYFSGGDIRGLLRALQSDQLTNVLSTPSLMTMDNAEAEIVVGQNVPFITGQFTNNATTPDNPFQTIERRDVGIILRVRPQINEGDAVRLDIEQEVSSIDRDATGSDLITNERSITTSVLVDDGQVIVLGGLIEENQQETAQKIPLLGDIPLVGNLFRNSRNDTTQTNLMVFLRPSIVRDQQAGRQATERSFDQIRKRQVDQAAEFNPLVRGGEVPVLPPLDELLE